jgi:uncharacterized heparinase superfamily protein
MQTPSTLFYGSALYHLFLAGPVPRDLAFRLEAWPGDPLQGAAFLAGKFRFKDETVEAAHPPWQAQAREEWRAELHRFQWLADLASVGTEAAAKAARDWTADWLASFDIFDGLAWRADVLGDRLFAWIEHFGRLAGDPPQESLKRAVLQSFARQTRHLYRIAHKAPPGLARLKALRGLVAALAALNLEGKLNRSLLRLGREIDTQLLPDGGHAARSPAAQLTSLRCLIDARAALVAAQVEIPGKLQAAIDRATPMLRFFRHGDGRFALFNGANEDDAATIERVLGRAEAKGRAPTTAPHSGFERLRAAHSLLLMDCGKPPPAGFDFDAHAGTLSFELSHGRERLIVNCGAYHGGSAEWRDASRATAAHSTLIVADTNSCEFRPDGSIAHGPSEVTSMRAEEAGAQWVAASHDGYKKGLGITHARQLFLAADGEDIRGEDRLTGKSGQGFAIRFHLHPGVQASLTQDGNAVLLRLPSGIGWRLRAQGAVLSIADSIYLGEGGMKRSRQVILDGHVGTSGAVVKWAIRREAKKQVDAPDTLPDLG